MVEKSRCLQGTAPVRRSRRQQSPDYGCMPNICGHRSSVGALTDENASAFVTAVTQCNSCIDDGELLTLSLPPCIYF
ncbi:unnamed protein product [Taenia asiatica]|uniref:Uncharacterized protein n=1 Tax=Taenia asiatica TaxID=60517 RepID=A0A3P6NMK8_TAEAS|nr:unnamed protein product [Taenia asiatica]